MSKRTGKGSPEGDAEEATPEATQERSTNSTDEPPRQDGAGRYGQGRAAEDAAAKKNTPGRAVSASRRFRMASIPYSPNGRDPRTNDEIHAEDATIVSIIEDLDAQIQAARRQVSRYFARLHRNLETLREREGK